MDLLHKNVKAMHILEDDGMTRVREFALSVFFLLKGEVCVGQKSRKEGLNFEKSHRYACMIDVCDKCTSVLMRVSY